MTTEVDGYAVADVLNRAADLLEADGWCKGAMHNDAGERCALGALAATIKSGQPVVTVTRALDPYVGGTVAGWNDAKGRTKQEVLDVFRAAAKDQMRAADETAGKP